MNIVYKFGGTSLENSKKIKQVAKFISREKKNNRLFVVVSAMGKTTNKLVKLANSFSDKMGEEYAGLVSLGEQISAWSLANALKKLNIESEVLTAKKLIYAKGDFDNATITQINVNRLRKIPKQKVVIICGFQGENQNLSTVLLGRGGSDTTAVALGAVLNAKVKIFTDVNGFYNYNPNEFENAELLKKINIKSALNLATAGAKVLDSRCLMLANKYNVDVEVLKSMSSSGTKVEYGELEGIHIDGISYLQNLFLLKVNGQQVLNKNIIKKFVICENKTLTQYIVTKKLLNSTQNSTSCGIVCIAGSGLDVFETFQQQLFSVTSKFKKDIYLLDISSTSINIVVKKDVAKKLVESFINVIYEQIDIKNA